MRPHHPLTRKRFTRRRGAVTIWVIVATPAMLAMLVLVSDVSNLWLARVELENAVEAAALAAADSWGGGGDSAIDRSVAHNRAATLFDANLVRFTQFTLDPNDDSSKPNNNATVPGPVMLGSYNSSLATFDATATGPIPDMRACYVKITVPVQSLWTGFAGPFQLTAIAVARYDAGSGTAKLVHVDPNDDPTSAP
jgi:uncharacterized membrane protein